MNFQDELKKRTEEINKVIQSYLPAEEGFAKTMAQAMNLVPGGVYGASIVLHNLFPSIQVGTFCYMFDIPLLIISVLVLGAKLGARTIVAALFTPLAMNVLSLLSYP